jgi:hypothetical protein
VEIALHNSVTVPLKTVEVKISGKNKEGNMIPSTNIDADLMVDPAHIDLSTGEVSINTTRMLFIANADESPSEEFDEIILAPNLVNCLGCAPDSMYIPYTPLLMTKEQISVLTIS